MIEKYYPIELEKVIDVSSLVSIHYFNYSKNFNISGESHNFWEFIYVDSGCVTITDDSAEFVLTQGQGFLHFPNHFHKVKTNGNFANIIIFSFYANFNFQGFFTDKIFSVTTNERVLINTVVSEGKICFFEPLNIVELEKMTPNSGALFGSQQIIKNAIESLLISLSRNITLFNSEEKGYFAQKNLVGKIEEILKKNLNKSISLSRIANSVNYSITYIKSVFKSITGKSIIRYYNSLKIDEAKKLISENTYSLSEISEMLGFESSQYFSRQFRQFANMSPSQYLSSVKLINVL